MSAFLMDFLDKSKGISLATTSVFNIKLLFYVFFPILVLCLHFAMWEEFTIAESLFVVDRMILNYLLLIFTQI